MERHITWRIHQTPSRRLIGTSTHVSQALGRGDTEAARIISSRAHLLVFVLVLSLSIAGLLTIDPLFTALGATADVLPLVRSYMTIWFVGLPFVLLPMVGMNVFRRRVTPKLPASCLPWPFCSTSGWIPC